MIRGNIPNLVIDNTTNNKSASAGAQLNLYGTTTINPGTTLTINGQVCLVIGPTFTNNGTLTGTATNTRFYFLGGAGATTYVGTGTVTAPLVSFEVDNPAGVTIDPGTTNQIVVTRYNNFSGGLVGSGKLTLGNGGATTAIVQLGLSGVVSPVTGFDVAPVFNPGTGGVNLLYAPELTARTTGNEMPPSRTLSLLNVTNTNGITIAGGDVTVNGTAAGALTMTNSPVSTGANTLYFNSSAGTVVRSGNGYVIGTFKKTFTASGSKTFEVGTANGYSPVAVNATTGTFPADFAVKATQGLAPFAFGANSLARYWTLTGSGVTANLTFTYLAGDVTGTVANYKFLKSNGGPVTVLNPNGTPTSTTAVINGVSSFSDWTLGEVPTYTMTYDGNGNTGGTAPVDSNSPYTATSTVTVPGSGHSDKDWLHLLGLEHGSRRQWHQLRSGTNVQHHGRHDAVCAVDDQYLHADLHG